jgi:hypothetical protein
MKVTKPLKSFFKKLLWGIINFELRKKGEECNILVYKCISYVEHIWIVMMVSKIMEKIGFGIGITT